VTQTKLPPAIPARFTLAHGDPFDGLPTGGLLKLVRDLINFAYRHYIAEFEGLASAAEFRSQPLQVQ
jgi:hypothetical protein